MTPIDQNTGQVESDGWWVHEPRRFAADCKELAQKFPALAWKAEDSGQWEGELPLWPFDRPQPRGLNSMLRGRRLRVLIQCGQAYPLVVPRLFALDPEPQLGQRLQHRWHVNSDGSLCLLADPTYWTNRMPLGDLLLKAAGWRIEYELMVRGAIESMTSTGIVSDAVLDLVIEQVANERSADVDG